MDEGTEGNGEGLGMGRVGDGSGNGRPAPTGMANEARSDRRPSGTAAMPPVDPAINRAVSARSMDGEREHSRGSGGDDAAGSGASGSGGDDAVGVGGAVAGAGPSVEGEEAEAPVELRARIALLESLLEARRALAATTHDAAARRAICARVAAVLGCDVVAIIELDAAAGTVTVAGSDGADLDGRTVAAERAALSAAALSGAEPELIGDLAQCSSAAAWPLQQAGCGAGAWQPIERVSGVSSLIAAGWNGAPDGPEPDLLAALAELAGDAALALDRAGAIAELSEMARTDPLTEVANRRSWEDELQRELARADRLSEPVAVGLLDLDELKTFNDRWGHAAGDRLLLTAAARWRRRLRMTDVLARIGGDEFGVILPGCGIEQAASLGEQLRRVMPEGLSCSVGVAEWVPGESAAALLARADEALYAAKRAGRDATFVLRHTAQGPIEGSVP